MYSGRTTGKEIHTNSKLHLSESLSQWLIHCTAICYAGHSAFTFYMLTIDVWGTVKISCVSIRINQTRQFAVCNITCLMLKSHAVHVITELFYPNNTDMCVCELYHRQLSVPHTHVCGTWYIWCVATMSSIPQMIMCSIVYWMYRCQLGAPTPIRLLCSLYDILVNIRMP
jgi:hypothetical protein